jgi:hypothetical protein
LQRPQTCARKGRYHVHKLIEKYGRKGNLMKWKEQLNGDCPRRDSRLRDRCDLVCPDLRVLSAQRWDASGACTICHSPHGTTA